MIQINPDKKSGITSIFSSNPKVFPDFFRGSIVNLSDIEFKKDYKHTLKKNCKIFSKMEGEWTNYLKFDDEFYWVNGEIDNFPLFVEPDFLLKSDSTFRKDLDYLIKGDTENAQKTKEEYEAVQRKDKELREKMLKQPKKK